MSVHVSVHFLKKSWNQKMLRNKVFTYVSKVTKMYSKLLPYTPDYKGQKIETEKNKTYYTSF